MERSVGLEDSGAEPRRQPRMLIARRPLHSVSVAVVEDGNEKEFQRTNSHGNGFLHVLRMSCIAFAQFSEST
jgi:hypothetical protein